MSLLTDFVKSLRYKFGNLKDQGLPATTFSFADFFGDISKQYPDRYNFYIQLLESLVSSHPEAVYFLLSKENLSLIQNRKQKISLDTLEQFFQERSFQLKDLKQALTKPHIASAYQTNPLDKLYEIKNNRSSIPTEFGEETDIDKIIKRKKLLLELKDVSQSLQKNPYLEKNFKQGLTIQNGTNNIELSNVQSGGDLSDFNKRIFDDSEPKNVYKDGKLVASEITDENVDRFMRDPIYSPNNDSVTMVDRVVFIAATFMVRAVAMFILEWAVHINYVSTFTGGFGLYFGVYICIFLLMYILTNASENDFIFRMVFYYIYTKSEDGQGIIRIWLHLLCVLMLIPIPFVVREYREYEKDSMTFSEKRTILNAVSRFSLYVWILTSIVALKV